MRRWRMVHCRKLGLALVSILTTITSQSQAKEVLVYDEVFDFVEADRGFRSFQPSAEMPANWVSPDDYYNGTMAVRYEIFSQPTSRQSKFNVCVWLTDGNETCSTLTALDGPGSVQTQVSSPKDWWTNSGPVDFTRPDLFDSMGMPLWSDTECIVSDALPEFCWDLRDDYYPIRMRLTVVAVSAGSTFGGFEPYLGGQDAGTGGSSGSGSGGGGSGGSVGGASGSDSGSGGAAGSSGVGAAGHGGGVTDAGTAGGGNVDGGSPPAQPSQGDDDGCSCRAANAAGRGYLGWMVGMGVVATLRRRWHNRR